MIRFTVYGEPKGKARPRFNSYTHRTYTDKATKDYEDLVKASYLEQVGKVSQDRIPLRMHLKAFLQPPKSVSRKTLERMEKSQIRPLKKPDVDNIGKSIADALNGIAYKDDSAIVDMQIEKYYSEIPRVEVEIEEL